ncbi:MAG: VacB/RNase II family 3'-5' exoribonuclease [Leptospirales bacterium]|nr:VacB/RNase II family 3'-5' exoribonuclease [Leptospirales bacterium]
MSISTKKIISAIDQLHSGFTIDDLNKKVIKISDESNEINTKNKRSKRKKKASQTTSKDILKINEILKALVYSGFIEKNKKRLIKKTDFIFDGEIQVNRKGDSSIEYNQHSVIIKKCDTNSAQNNDNVKVKIYDCRRGCFYGRVVSINTRKKELNIGRVTSKTDNLIIFRLLDVQSEINTCALKKDKNPIIGNFAEVLLTNNKISGMTECKAVNYFEEDDESFDFIRIRNRHSLPDDYRNTKEFNDSYSITEDESNNESNNRKDYTKLFTITIDGDSAKDFDDAISIKENKKSTKLYVHIADVSAYVIQGSELDIEAFKRGTSYYLGDKVIPMLPEVLSNDLCSLKEGVPRYTLTAEMTFNSNGDITKFDAFRGIINVNKRLTYNIAEDILNKKESDKISKTLHAMMKLATLLKNKRIKNGRIDLNISDEEIIYDDKKVKDIRFSKRLKSQSLIEEFMLSANETVSKTLKDNSVPALYRVHEKISDDNLLALKKFLQVLNIKIVKSKDSGKAIQNILKSVSGKPYEHVVNLVILKSMMQAYYGPEPLGHFGLGFLDYTHFTSPIRRYPDLIVHRCLKNFIDKKNPAYRTEELILLGEKSSEMERIAQKAERDFVKIKSCRLMKNRIGEKFDVTISGMTKFGIFVTLIGTPIEGMIPLRNFTDDYYILKEDDFTVIGRKYNKRYRLGDKIKARLVVVDMENLRIDFELGY